jgi:hypothetical protein
MQPGSDFELQIRKRIEDLAGVGLGDCELQWISCRATCSNSGAAIHARKNPSMPDFGIPEIDPELAEPLGQIVNIDAARNVGFC